MAVFCHRCGGELARVGAESSFCQHCGAPQLTVLEENVSLKRSTSPGPDNDPARRSSANLVWATAVAYAAAVAGVAALLMLAVLWLPAGFPLAWLLTVCGGVVVLGLYQRRHPATPVGAGLGAKVGLIYGLFAVATLSLTFAVAGLVARFGLHTLGTLDALLSNAMRQAAAQQAAQPGALALSADQIRTFYSPEVRAGLALFLLAVSASLLVLFSALGGAVGGVLRGRRLSRTGNTAN